MDLSAPGRRAWSPCRGCDVSHHLVIKARSSIERSNTSPNSSTKPSKANGSKTEDPVDLEAVRTLRKGAAATIEHPDPMALVRAAIREAGYAGDTGLAE